MRNAIANVREWWEDGTTPKKIALLMWANSFIVLLVAVVAICAVAIDHLMYLWNLVVG